MFEDDSKMLKDNLQARGVQLAPTAIFLQSQLFPDVSLG